MIPRLIHASLLLIFAVERPNSSRKLRGRRVLCEASLTKRHCHDGVPSAGQATGLFPALTATSLRVLPARRPLPSGGARPLAINFVFFL